MQAVDRARQKQPLTYYDRTGPFGQAFAQLPRASSAPEIAVVGLGIGSLASYAGVEQRWTFYEIDPAVERIARSPQYFTYLRDCGSRCQVVLGDARLSLASARPHQYALIVLDAFSSDAIPVHLMTAEALALFLTRLAPGGALAFHVSNRHLSLGPVLTRLALSQGLTVLEQHDDVTAAQIANGKAASDWVVMARDSSDLGPLIADARWRTPVVKASTPLWTDDFSNILSVLNFDLANSPLLQRSGAK
jgi:spermidine synthase